MGMIGVMSKGSLVNPQAAARAATDGSDGTCVPVGEHGLQWRLW